MQHWPWYLLIDESFIGLQGVRGDLTKRAHAIRARINQWVGIPCGVGIGQTKTLAKLANHIAKTAERKPGSYPAELAQVCNLAALPPQDLDDVLATTLVEEVWGGGSQDCSTVARERHTYRARLGTVGPCHGAQPLERGA